MAVDRAYLDRAIELARRGLGATSPNPPVGAVIVKDGALIGEGHHRFAGQPHAEIEALREAGDATGATMYVSIEPCNHFGKTPPCTRALIDARIARVVIGARDPNPTTNGTGISALQEAGIEVEVCDDPAALQLIEPFQTAIRSTRTYIALKMASSVNGFIASRQGEMQWLTGAESLAFVRDLRIAHDAVMVGAGTIRVDDPVLTVRPAHDRAKPYARIVVCESGTVSSESRVFAPLENYDRTIVLAPAGRKMLESLQNVADVVFVGNDNDERLDLRLAMDSLHARGVQSVLCEGGPTLAARLLEQRCVDRVYWLAAPIKIGGQNAVRALTQTENHSLPSIQFDRVERLGDDMMATGVVLDV
ncbi:MAG: bifunctional diaminohydroxyphosphoribosylaminopyrimidine deaminase/5-amino-6-(5-phosphoribosylamino)uracil reductase RibD [Candidatus Eremiobacteraeota bacterium]|nr:bifunctional diaminohydroxyphosphoribosylaminopyrimidine deaminase/5-amino-6-(5-phosphoribosylamino)uracil reductase RibD [Candidatus Eremiobacteraeota bacterium]